MGGLIAGFFVVSQLGLFDKYPWALPLYAAILSAKGVISGLLSGRLGTALHLGTIYPRFFNNTKSFYKLIHEIVVMTFFVGIVMTSLSVIVGSAFWGVTLAESLDGVIVVLATMALGLTLTLVTIKVAFVTFNRGLDPDIVVYPIMSTAADVFITFCYILVLTIFDLFSLGGKIVMVVMVILHLAVVLYSVAIDRSDHEFRKNLRESLVTMFFVSVIVNITGTVLKNIRNVVEEKAGEIITVLPALVDMVGDVGSVVGSTATTKLALGLLRPSLTSIRNHTRTIVSAWAASIVMFIVLSILSPALNGTLSISTFINILTILMLANIIAVIGIVLLSYGISILTFQRGLDPDNFVIPIESSFADSLMSIALLISLVLVG